MGTQWHGMGRDLMGIEAFHQSILRSEAALQQHGVKLQELITSSDERVFENTLNSFVGIVAIQVGHFKVCIQPNQQKTLINI